MSDDEIHDHDLLMRLHSIATAFAVAVAAMRAAAGLDPLTRVVVFVVDMGAPPLLALELDGVRIGTMPMDAAAGELVAVLVERGLGRMTATALHLANVLLQTGRAALVLLVPLGQQVVSTHGVLVDRENPAANVELCTLFAVEQTATVN
jgi:hypothetical protein